MKTTGTPVVHGASVLATVDAWSQPDIQACIWDSLRRTITMKGGDGQREYREVVYGTLTEAGEFLPQVWRRSPPTHVVVFLEVSP